MKGCWNRLSPIETDSIRTHPVAPTFQSSTVPKDAETERLRRQSWVGGNGARGRGAQQACVVVVVVVVGKGLGKVDGLGGIEQKD